MLLIIHFSLSLLKFEFIHFKLDLFVEIHKKKYQEVGRDKQV